jgi:hypothetical protein
MKGLTEKTQKTSKIRVSKKPGFQFKPEHIEKLKLFQDEFSNLI